MLLRKANREDPDQTASGLPCLSRLLWQAITVQNLHMMYVCLCVVKYGKNGSYGRLNFLVSSYVNISNKYLCHNQTCIV